MAVTGLIGALRRLSSQINGRLEQLLEHATDSAHKQGELEGRDFMRRLLAGPEPHHRLFGDDIETPPPSQNRRRGP